MSVTCLLSSGQGSHRPPERACSHEADDIARHVGRHERRVTARVDAPCGLDGWHWQAATAGGTRLVWHLRAAYVGPVLVCGVRVAHHRLVSPSMPGETPVTRTR